MTHRQFHTVRPFPEQTQPSAYSTFATFATKRPTSLGSTFIACTCGLKADEYILNAMDRFVQESLDDDAGEWLAEPDGLDRLDRLVGNALGKKKDTDGFVKVMCTKDHSPRHAFTVLALPAQRCGIPVIWQE